MTKLKRSMLISCSIILLCMCAVVGITYALFTDSVDLRNHLQAGILDVRLIRTDLEYAVLDDEGYLTVYHPALSVTDFTNATDKNVFGIDGKELFLVPGSYFDAKLAIQSAGNVAFDYSISVQLFGEASDLADQLRVTVSDADGKTVGSAMLSELAGGMSIAIGTMEVDAEPAAFGVRVDFVDQSDYNTQPGLDIEDYIRNNDAQNEIAEFDLIVRAVQATR